MRTTLNIDDKALAEAMKYSRGKNKTQVINHALREYSKRKHLQGLLDLRGKISWEGNLDELRKRK